MPQLCASVVTYRPKEEILRHVELILQQVEKLILVDNASGPESLVFLRQLENKFSPRLQIIYNEENLGISVAQNQAARIALAENFQWLITFDQDSSPKPQMLQEMLAVYASLPPEVAQKTGLLVPTYFYPSTQVLNKQNPKNSPWCQILGAMSSGSLIKAGIFREVGFFNEKVFLDYFDSEFQFRVGRKGFLVIEASNVVLEHQLGSLKRTQILGKTFIPSNQNYLRRYYQARDKWLIYADNWQYCPKWILQDARNQIMEKIKIILAEEDKLRKLQYALLGNWHALLGKTGPLKK